ncbi:hypothetical protein CHU95_17315 [Niveispirillum lacus]|uniref:Tetratricopeptide repeat-like domain-containing protein n=1 Tax=Niveispirillum lacus TaxID=1981099 RepID=A0A255YTH6_9PROT|nr:hypothetical protein [Niveispirillum lacus]OYQ32546.1 hypothetical protein CHU95_17315 [Niveispirillum lacus]
MIRTRLFTAALLGTALAFGSFAAIMAPSEAFAQKASGDKKASGETVRPEVGTPLQAAQELVKQKKYKEALVKVKEADAVPNKTPFEASTVLQFRVAVAQAAGDANELEKAMEALIATGALQQAQQGQYALVLAQSFLTDKNFPKTISWAQKAISLGANESQARTMLLAAYFESKDYANAVKEMSLKIATAEKAGQKPTQRDLEILASLQLSNNNEAGYTAVLERLVGMYPEKKYWEDLLNRVQRKPGFNRDRLALDIYRLKYSIGLLESAGELMEMAQLSLQAGNPGEAQAVIDKGYTSGVMGTGPEAERQKRLKDMAAKQVGDDKKALAQTESEALAGANAGPILRVAEAYAGYGQFDKAATLAEAAIAKGNLKNPDDARLRLVTYYLALGQKAKAEATAKAIKATDGPADLARLSLLAAKAK